MVTDLDNIGITNYRQIRAIKWKSIHLRLVGLGMSMPLLVSANVRVELLRAYSGLAQVSSG